MKGSTAHLFCAAICLCASLPVFVPGSAWSQKPEFAGDYAGVSGPLHVKLHLIASANGTLNGTIDSPDQGMVGIPCADFHVNGQTLSFSVPMVRGTWIGILSNDGVTLSGMWSQGAAVALNLTRVTAAKAGIPSAAPQPVAAAAAPPVPSSASEPACPVTMSFNYFDGSAWKPMMMAVALPKERGTSLSGGFKDLAHNPLNPRAGQTNLFRYKDSAAPLTLGPNPRLCVTISPSFNPSQILIGAVAVKKDHRELEQLISADSWMPRKDIQDVVIKQISSTVVEITPKQPLPPGQYVIGGPPMIAIYDFGVAADK